MRGSRVLPLLCSIFLAGLLPYGARVIHASGSDEADIRALIDRWLIAWNTSKDAKAIMSCYVPDETLVVFDIIPPQRYVGAKAYGKDFADFFAAFPKRSLTMSDVQIVTGGGVVAYSHASYHLSLFDKAGQKLEMIIRVTNGYRKVGGKWLIQHEHDSLPVDLITGKPDFMSK